MGALLVACAVARGGQARWVAEVGVLARVVASRRLRVGSMAAAAAAVLLLRGSAGKGEQGRAVAGRFGFIGL